MMIKMFKILPRKTKFQFFLGIFVLLINVGLTMMTPIFISQFLPLLINKDSEFSIHLFKHVIFATNTFQKALTFLISITVTLIVLGAITSFVSLW
ncbi:Uncharacterised protein, partial [Mycoplasmopsis edwardii]